MIEPPRRRVLAAAATGSTLSLAGCSSLGSDGTGSGDGAGQTEGSESDGEGETDETGSAASTGSATAAVDIQADLQAVQTDVRERLQAGNITEEEAQAEIQEAQMELLEEAVSTVETHAADTDGLDVSRTNERAGAVLVSGDPGAVLGVLDTESVTALLSADDFPEPDREAENESS
ncbi:MAG: hypothetical protein ACOCRD_02130 [Halorubrum sp.]